MCLYLITMYFVFIEMCLYLITKYFCLIELCIYVNINYFCLIEDIKDRSYAALPSTPVYKLHETQELQSALPSIPDAVASSVILLK